MASYPSNHDREYEPLGEHSLFQSEGPDVICVFKKIEYSFVFFKCQQKLSESTISK